MPLGYLFIASALLVPTHSPLKTDDYPVDALRDERSAAAIVDVFADPDGRVLTCNTVRSFGDSKLAGQICELLKRKHFAPATDSHGQKSYGWSVELDKMWIPGTKQGDSIASLAWTPTVRLPTSGIPVGAEKGPVRVVFGVDQTGKAADCAARSGENRSDLVFLVCTALHPTFPIKADKQGQAVSYVTQLDVELGAAPAKAPDTQP